MDSLESEMYESFINIPGKIRNVKIQRKETNVTRNSPESNLLYLYQFAQLRHNFIPNVFKPDKTTFCETPPFSQILLPANEGQICTQPESFI